MSQNRLVADVIARHVAAQRRRAEPPPPIVPPSQAFADGEFRQLPQPHSPKPTFKPQNERRLTPAYVERQSQTPQPPKPQNSGPMIRLSARTLKCSMLLDPAALASVPVRDGVARVELRVDVAGRTVSASINSKSLRRGVATIHSLGPDAVIVTVQGKLVGEIVEEAGLAVMAKTSNPAPVEAPQP